MAHGGQASRFCDEDRAHEPDCEYFKAGGEVDIPADEVQIDKPHDIPANEVIPDAEIPANEVKLDAPQDEIPPDEVIPDNNHESPLEQLKAGAEGAAQGYLGPLAPYLETKLLGVKPEDISGRAAANPWTHGIAETAGLVGGFLTGTGEAGLIAKATKAIPEIAALGKVGSAALRAAVQGASFAAADETTKYLLDQQGGDPKEAVAKALMHIGATGIITAASAPLFNIMGNGLNAIGQQKMADGAEKLLAKLGNSGDPVNQAAAMLYGGYKGMKTEGSWEHKAGAAVKAYAEVKYAIPYLSKMLGIPLAKFNDRATDAIIRALLKNSPQGVSAAMQFGSSIANGAKKALPAIDAIFKSGTSQVVPKVSDELMEELNGRVEEGTPQIQMQNEMQNDNNSTPLAFASGGSVSHQSEQQTDHFGTVFPEANILMNEAKGRVYQYLNSIRPLPQPKLPYDKPAKDEEKKRSYNKALKLAVNPLQILNHIQDSSLTPEMVGHFTKLWPEIHSSLSKQMTERITKDQLKGGNGPSYGKRQAMSLFMGTNLDSSMTQQSIQAVQSVFAQKQMAQQQGPMKNKKGTSSLGKSSQGYLTDDQARERRQQSSKN